MRSLPPLLLLCQCVNSSVDGDRSISGINLKANKRRKSIQTAFRGGNVHPFCVRGHASSCGDFCSQRTFKCILVK